MSVRSNIPPLSVVIDEVHHLFARVKDFSTGSKGWYASEKMELGGERCQVSVTVTIIGSKPKGGDSRDKREELQGQSKMPERSTAAFFAQDGEEVIEVEEQAQAPSGGRPKAKR